MSVMTMENSSNRHRPRQRDNSKQFKATVLERCAQPGASQRWRRGPGARPALEHGAPLDP